MPARLDALTRSRAGAGTLARLEVATAIAFGRDAGRPSFARRTAAPPLAALERALIGALRRAPCVVSFSGGRDSSALLAVATRVTSTSGPASRI